MCTYSAAECLERIHGFLTVITRQFMTNQERRNTNYLALYLLISSDRPADVDGIGSKVDGRAEESSR